MRVERSTGGRWVGKVAGILGVRTCIAGQVQGLSVACDMCVEKAARVRWRVGVGEVERGDDAKRLYSLRGNWSMMSASVLSRSLLDPGLIRLLLLLLPLLMLGLTTS